MKKRNISKLAILAGMAILFSSSVMVSSSARAQSCGGVPDCMSDPWTGPYTTTVYVDNGCHNGDSCPVLVKYCTRLACSTFHDVEIIWMGYVPSCFCDDTIFDTEFNKAANKFLNLNYMGFPCPTCGQGSTSAWRFFSAGCSTEYYDQTSQKYIWEPCNNTGLFCYDTWDICCTNGVPQKMNERSGFFGDPSTCTQQGCNTSCFHFY